jgi:hypothetical protein
MILTRRLAAGALAFGALFLTAPGASAMTFQEACGITRGWYVVVATAGIEECHWQEPDGNEWMRTNPLPPPPTKQVPPPPLAPRN